MSVLNMMEPKEVFQFFEIISEIPHPCYHTEKLTKYCINFAHERHLDVSSDRTGSVIIKKPGTSGYEKSAPIILQGHLDMICEKSMETVHDFYNDPLKIYVEDGMIRAEGTSLGADNGFGVAMILAILNSEDIPHPPIEAILTTDEEKGMGGARSIDFSNIKGKTLINLDSTREGILTVGCAGAINAQVDIPIKRVIKEGTIIRIRIYGLKGGHSGTEIHKQKFNAHKMMTSILNKINRKFNIFLVEMNGGSQDNVISVDTRAEILVKTDEAEKIQEEIKNLINYLQEDLVVEEPDLTFGIKLYDDSLIDVCDRLSTDKVIAYLNICPNGVIEYSRRMKGTVGTSLNLGVVETHSNFIRIRHMVRSMKDLRAEDMVEILEQCATLVGAKLVINNRYPAWPLNMNSPIKELLSEVFLEMYGYDPEITAVHAGLECAMFYDKRKDLDCISFGPDIFDTHSSYEHMDIESAKRCWSYLKAVLKKCK
ncbi:MAG: beta-Ala-His dipeptidase [Dorea sp.]|nr:beta-Ala-His dipeptidase [Dorea sp.]